MSKNIDILLDADGDLLLDGEEPVVGDVTQQNQTLLLNLNKGDLKLYPLIGVGVINFLQDENYYNLLAEIRRQFASDGMKIKKIELKNDKLTIDASYI